MIRNLAYVGLDFLLTPDNEVYFIEANPSAFGIYFIDIMTRYLRVNGVSRDRYLHNDGFTDKFVNMLIKFAIMKKSYFPFKIGLYFDQHLPYFLQDEYIYIKNSIDARGYRCILFTNEQLTIKDGEVYVRYGGSLEHIDLVINRGVGLPTNIKVPVVNNPIVVKIVGNKIYSNYVVSKLVMDQGLYSKGLNVPESYLINTLDDLPKYSKMLGDKGMLLKPASFHDGLGIVVARDRKHLIRKVSRLGGKWFRKYSPFILQELIDVKPFLSGDNKYYTYDIRVYCLIGEPTGGLARRSPKPIGSKAPLENIYISDITSGGSIINLIIDCDDVKNVRIGGLYIRSRDRIIFIDDNALCIPKSLLNKIYNYADLIVKELDSKLKSLLH